MDRAGGNPWPGAARWGWPGKPGTATVSPLATPSLIRDAASEKSHTSIARHRLACASVTPERFRARPALAIGAALALVYVIWGSTYLAIRVGIRTIPPFLLGSVRFILAGAILYAIAVRHGDRDGDRPGPKQWTAASIVGVALLFGGNGGVSWGLQRVPTGISALLVATVPLWMVLIARIAHGERLPPQVVAGIVAGFGGIVLLVRPSGPERIDPLGAAVVLLASLSWAAGSVYARRAPLPKRPFVAAGMELMAGGVALAIAGAAGGELGRLHPSEISGESLLSLAYLIVLGSIVAYSAYIWLLHHTPTSVASTYAYVNPIVAVLLGWAVLDETITARTVLGGAIIVVAVALIVTARPAAATETAAAAAAPEERVAAPVPVRLPAERAREVDRGS